MSATKLIGTGCIALLAFYVISFVWETRRVDAFCTELSPGMPADAIASAGRRHGIPERAFEGIKTKEGTWFAFVPILHTMGDSGCIVERDANVIIRVKRVR